MGMEMGRATMVVMAEGLWNPAGLSQWHGTLITTGTSNFSIPHRFPLQVQPLEEMADRECPGFRSNEQGILPRPIGLKVRGSRSVASFLMNICASIVGRLGKAGNKVYIIKSGSSEMGVTVY